MCITIHFIDSNWILQKRILAFTRIEPPHTGANISTIIYNILQEFKIVDKVFTLTLDNASENTVAARDLKSILKLNCDGSFFHGRCVCHILNIIVQNGLQYIKLLIDKIRSTVLHLSGSEKRAKIFYTFCKRYNMKYKKILLDVPHRWNSTYLMLDVALDYRIPLNEYISWHQHQVLSSQSTSSTTYFLEHPTEEEWAQADCMRLFLKFFYDATVAMSASYESTVVIFYHHLIKIIDIFFQYASVDTFTPILVAIKKKFKKYWNTLPVIYGLAVIIDPQLKEAYLPNIFDAIYGSDASSSIEIHATRIKLISITFKILFDEYSV